MRILVVEDQRTVRKLLVQSLISLGYSQIREAENGLKALDLLRAEAFNLVITDVEMPQMDGLALLGAIRQDPALSPIPVLMVTVVDQKDKIIQAIKTGVSGYIVKPFTLEAIKDKLNKLGLR